MAQRVVKNIGFLGLSQAANYLLPLITIPYITRVVGPQNYGLIEFASTAMLYFSSVVIYGFGTTGTRLIAQKPQEIDHVSTVFSSVLLTRLSLFLFSTLVFIACIYTIPKFGEERLLMITAFPLVLGWALYPAFIFQGTQKLQYVAIANFAVKAIAALAIFIFLQEPEDFFLVLGINAGAQILVAILLLILSFRLLPGLHLKPVSLRGVKSYLTEGSYVFLSNFFMRISKFSPVLFIGLYLAESQIGLFAASLKLVVVAHSFLFLPLAGAMFPHLANVFARDRNLYLKNLKRSFYTMLAIGAVSSAVIILFPNFFISLVFGPDYLPAVPYLQIMAPLLTFAVVSHFSLQQGLSVLSKDKTYLGIVVLVGIVTVVLNVTLIEPYGIRGAAFIKLSVDVFLALLGAYFFTRAWRNLPNP